MNYTGRRIDTLHFSHPDLQVSSLLEYFPEGEGNTAGLQLRRGNLVKQRLKLVMVELINEQDIKEILVEVFHKLNTCKTAADYHYFFSVHPAKVGTKTGK